MTRAVRTCRRTWRRLGVPRAVTVELTEELEADLAAAAADGAEPSAILGADPRRFARDWAAARGAVRARPRLVATALAALVGAIPGVSFALLFAYGLTSRAVGELLSLNEYCADPPACTVYLPETLEPAPWLLVLLYTMGGLLSYAGAVAAIAAFLHWRLDPAAAATSRLCARALPAGAALAALAGVVVAWTRGFSANIDTALGVVAAAAGVFAVATVLLRLRALRDHALG
ncbi:MAG: hypothetical protein IT201_06880 [Thermoleophilia bacterium]|nr:hypothetical protein [Thermoleophilia bacterium]